MKKLLLLAVVLLAVVTVGRGLLGTDPERLHWEFLPDMVRSTAYRAQSANPHFPDGRTQRPLIPGTIARGYMPFDYGVSPEDLERAGSDLRSPFDGQRPTNLERGADLYGAYCQTCHGASGAGQGPVAQRGYPPPPSLLTESSQALSDGELYHLITLGRRIMPAYGSLMAREDRWQVIHYLRQLQQEAQ